MTRMYVRLRGRLERAIRADDGVSTVEAIAIVAAVGGAALVFVAAFTGAADGLMDDFTSVFPGAGD